MYKNSSGYSYADCVAACSVYPQFPKVDEAYWTASGKLNDLFQREAAIIRGEIVETLSEEDKAEMQRLIEYIAGRREYFESLTAPETQPLPEYSEHETRSMYRQVPGGAPNKMEKNPDYGVRALNGLFPIVR